MTKKEPFLGMRNRNVNRLRHRNIHRDASFAAARIPRIKEDTFLADGVRQQLPVGSPGWAVISDCPPQRERSEGLSYRVHTLEVASSRRVRGEAIHWKHQGPVKR